MTEQDYPAHKALALTCVYRRRLSHAAAMAEAFDVFMQWVSPATWAQTTTRGVIPRRDTREIIIRALQDYPYSVSAAQKRSGIPKSTFYRHMAAIRSANDGMQDNRQA